MKRTMLIGKIHRATITGADVSYDGSLTLDPQLMEAAGILPHEKVHVFDVDNGARFETYVIEGTHGAGDVVVNGAAARLVVPGDRAIIVAYGEMEEAEARRHRPKVVLVDEANRPVSKFAAEA